MAQKQAKRPRSAKSRTLPPDAPSLAQMIRSVHRQLMDRTAHLKKEPHDVHARHGFQSLHEDRARAYARLRELDYQTAEALRTELGLTYTLQPEVL